MTWRSLKEYNEFLEQEQRLNKLTDDLMTYFDLMEPVIIEELKRAEKIIKELHEWRDRDRASNKRSE